MDSVCVRIYNKEKTIAGCFKFRNKIGIDIAIDALKDYSRRPYRNVEELLNYARIDRIENVIRPYIALRKRVNHSKSNFIIISMKGSSIA